MYICGIPINLHELVDYYKFDLYKAFKVDDNITYDAVIRQLMQFPILNLTDLALFHIESRYKNNGDINLFSTLQLFPITNQKIAYTYKPREKSRGLIEKVKKILDTGLEKQHIEPDGPHFIWGLNANNEQEPFAKVLYIKIAAKKYEIFNLFNKDPIFIVV